MIRFRSAITGRWVSALWAKIFPCTTVRETLSERDQKIGGSE